MSPYYYYYPLIIANKLVWIEETEDKFKRQQQEGDKIVLFISAFY